MNLLYRNARVLFLRTPLRKSTRPSSRRLSSKVESRNPNYATLNSNDLSFFEKLLDKTRCITSPTDLVGFNSDWLKAHRGESKLVLMPRTTEELSEIMRYCHKRRLAVCAQGGNTGLVGGSVPVYDELIVSSRLMNRIYGLDTDSSIIRCQSGCILQNLDDYAAKNGDLMMPLDLGAKGSCHIGGNVATNAGGLRLLRYGSLKGNVLGLEVVLADGRVINTMDTALRKDNTGYDLNQLFIGSEGTLGFISGVSVLCARRPKSTNVMVMAIEGESFANVIDVFKVARRELNEILSAFEFWDAESMRAATENLGLASPFDESSTNTSFYCLAETHGSCQDHDLGKIESFYSRISTANLCKKAVIAENKAQFDSLWSLRERLPESLARDGYNYKYDLSLPLKDIYKLVEEMRERLKGSGFKRCTSWAHLGDGNLHLNVSSARFDPKLLALIEPFVFEWTKQRNGSISAEHGIGRVKRGYIQFSKSSISLDYMKNIKSLFDPNMILNPYKTIPE